MKRILKIILLLLLVLALIMTMVWLRARKQAVKDDEPAPSFRTFLGLGNRDNVPAPSGSGSGLTPDQQGSGSGSTGGSSQGDPVLTSDIVVSQFTSGPLSPGLEVTPTPLPSTTGTTSTGIMTNTTTLGTGTTTGSGTTTVITVAGPACTDADVNIEFTADEIARLAALQTRFYAIAGNLNSDADIATEATNYVDYKTKADKIGELYNYCVAVAPRITSNAFRARTATPFWRNAAQDGVGYMPGATGGPTALSAAVGESIDPREIQRTQGIIQRIFKVNLW